MVNTEESNPEETNPVPEKLSVNTGMAKSVKDVKIVANVPVFWDVPIVKRNIWFGKTLSQMSALVLPVKETLKLAAT